VPYPPHQPSNRHQKSNAKQITAEPAKNAAELPAKINQKSGNIAISFRD
jgi:hypothetical protein